MKLAESIHFHSCHLVPKTRRLSQVCRHIVAELAGRADTFHLRLGVIHMDTTKQVHTLRCPHQLHQVMGSLTPLSKLIGRQAAQAAKCHLVCIHPTRLPPMGITLTHK